MARGEFRYENLTDAIKRGHLRMPIAEYAWLHGLERDAEMVSVLPWGDDESHVGFYFVGRLPADAAIELDRLGFRRRTWSDTYRGVGGDNWTKVYPRAVRANPRAHGDAMAKKRLTKKQLKEKYERCVKKVKKRGGAANPWAVCRAQMNRTHGKKAMSAALTRAPGRRHNPTVIRPVPVRETGPRGYDPLRVLGLY